MEFTLDPTTDRIDVIAAEMVEELGLTFAVADLSKQISLLIQVRQIQWNKDSGQLTIPPYL